MKFIDFTDPSKQRKPTLWQLILSFHVCEDPLCYFLEILMLLTHFLFFYVTCNANLWSPKYEDRQKSSYDDIISTVDFYYQ